MGLGLGLGLRLGLFERERKRARATLRLLCLVRVRARTKPCLLYSVRLPVEFTHDSPIQPHSRSGLAPTVTVTVIVALTRTVMSTFGMPPRPRDLAHPRHPPSHHQTLAWGTVKLDVSSVSQILVNSAWLGTCCDVIEAGFVPEGGTRVIWALCGPLEADMRHWLAGLAVPYYALVASKKHRKQEKRGSSKGQHEPDPKSPPDDDGSALTAARWGLLDRLEAYVAAGRDAEAALGTACGGHDTGRLQALVTCRDRHGNMPLLLAASEGTYTSPTAAHSRRDLPDPT